MKLFKQWRINKLQRRILILESKVKLVKLAESEAGKYSKYAYTDKLIDLVPELDALVSDLAKLEQ